MSFAKGPWANGLGSSRDRALCGRRSFRGAWGLTPGRPTPGGRVVGHVHLGRRLLEERACGLGPPVEAEFLHAVASHHDARAARTAEAGVLHHANELDAAAATRPVETG